MARISEHSALVHSAYLAGSAFKKFSLGNLNFLHAFLPHTYQLTMCYKVMCYHPYNAISLDRDEVWLN